MSEPRAYTEDEVRDMIVEAVRDTAHYWANLPSFDRATGRYITTQDRCEGVAFSILSMLDGCSMTLPSFDLVLAPHPEDKDFLKSQGENWFEPDMKISTSLHEFFHTPSPSS